MKPTTILEAHQFYADEHAAYGMDFSHSDCIEDIHRIYGSEAAREVNNSIATDMPELGIDLIPAI
jgi:hypothetical protein